MNRLYFLQRLPLPLFLLPLLIFSLPLLFSISLSAQKDSVLFNSNFKFVQGIYLTFADFKNNKPITKSAIISDYDHNEIDFLRKMVSTRSINYRDSSGKVWAIAPEKLWGFCENNSVYIRFSGDFNKIVVMGNICHFTAKYTTYLSASPTTVSGPTNGAPVESIQQYVLDTQTGKVFDYTLSNMEELFKRDADLYKEFMAMKKGKRKQMMFMYLRKYNEKHGLYFLATD